MPKRGWGRRQPEGVRHLAKLSLKIGCTKTGRGRVVTTYTNGFYIAGLDNESASEVILAGPASVSSSRPPTPKGGTGFAVATILEYVTSKS